MKEPLGYINSFSALSDSVWANTVDQAAPNSYSYSWNLIISYGTGHQMQITSNSALRYLLGPNLVTICSSPIWKGVYVWWEISWSCILKEKEVHLGKKNENLFINWTISEYCIQPEFLFYNQKFYFISFIALS